MTLREACAVGAAVRGLTHQTHPVDGARLLWAISGCESDFGRQREFVRAEPAYLPGGKYFGTQALAPHWHRWGVLASSSFGSFQILFVTAYELGFRGHPIDLQQDEIGAKWATRLITDRLIGRQGAATLAKVLDGYNSGTHRDGHVPAGYVAKGIRYYVGAQGWPVPPAVKENAHGSGDDSADRPRRLRRDLGRPRVDGGVRRR